MINQRKRIAIIDVNNKALNMADQYVDTIVNYNINFNPKYAYVHLENNDGSQASVTSSFIMSQNKPNFFNGQNSYIKEVSKNRIVISAQRYNGIFVTYIKKIVLIE